jgi:RNA polymerase sigma-70 factor, ECF subfamily
MRDFMACLSSAGRAALDQLVPVVYPELRRLARRHLFRQSPGQPLQTTDLVSEAYLKLAQLQGMDWEDRPHLFSLASCAMHSLLVDDARKRSYAKRGGNTAEVSLDDGPVPSEERAPEALAIDVALRRLSALDPRKSQVVELRFFGGLSIDETAIALQVSPATVNREWAKAKAWLYDELR